MDKKLEMAMLGRMLMNNGGYGFQEKRHSIILGVIKRLQGSDIDVDVVTVGLELKNRGQLELIGGADYLTDLTVAAYK